MKDRDHWETEHKGKKCRDGLSLLISEFPRNSARRGSLCRAYWTLWIEKTDLKVQGTKAARVIRIELTERELWRSAKQPSRLLSWVLISIYMWENYLKSKNPTGLVATVPGAHTGPEIVLVLIARPQTSGCMDHCAEYRVLVVRNN